jgi:hypothetical protein
VLFVSAGLCAAACFHVVAAKKMKQVRVLKANSFIGFSLVVDEEREVNPGFFTEEARVSRVSQADYGDVRPFFPEC